MSPLPPLLGVIAIAGGVLGGLELASAVGPGLPSADAETAEVEGGGADSLFRSSPLFIAVHQADRELGERHSVAGVTIKPGKLDLTPAGGTPGTLPLDQLPVQAPERMIAGINRARGEAGRSKIRLGDVKSFRWRPTEPTSSEWYALLDVTTAGPPTQFVASRDGSRVRNATAADLD